MFAWAGFDFPAEFGADRAPLKPVVQLQAELDWRWLDMREIKYMMGSMSRGARDHLGKKLAVLSVINTFFLLIQWVLAHNSALSRGVNVAL